MFVWPLTDNLGTHSLCNLSAHERISMYSIINAWGRTITKNLRLQGVSSQADLCGFVFTTESHDLVTINFTDGAVYVRTFPHERRKLSNYTMRTTLKSLCTTWQCHVMPQVLRWNKVVN